MIFLRKPLIFILITGIVIRLFLSASTFHTDIQHFDLAGYVLGKGNLLNFYDYTYNLRSRLPILGGLTLPLANVKFVYQGKSSGMDSNKLEVKAEDSKNKPM